MVRSSPAQRFLAHNNMVSVFPLNDHLAARQPERRAGGLHGQAGDMALTLRVPHGAGDAASIDQPFRRLGHPGARRRRIPLRDRMVAPVPWPGEDAQRDVERHAVLAQGPRSICRAFGGARADDGIDEEGSDQIGALPRAGCRPGRCPAVRAGNLERAAASWTRAFAQLIVGGSRCHFNYVSIWSTIA